ncbi:MAG TPA: TIGR02466 family protein [Gemmataceae bacterium]|nr:TIGR02466 family protein [Gemmataceae bacterium]
MADQPETHRPAADQPVEAGVMPLFSTWVYQCEHGPRQLNDALEQLARRLMQDDGNAVRRTNRGGWHYAFDLFKVNDPVVAAFQDEMEQHVQAFLDSFRPADRRNRYRFVLEGWINVNRAGDSNVLHCHPGCFLSATYYVKVPPDMRGGEIYFRDPRGPAVAMYETPGIDLPWVGSGMGIPFTPATGLLLLFPSWLEHRVEPFDGPGERISVAFNVRNPAGVGCA